jgi:proteasome lid subunit RPN8/RPN11
VISRTELRRLARAAELAAPAEACGLLGAAGEGGRIRLRVFPLPNATRSPNGFRITRRELAAGCRSLRRRGLILYGCFHSHPTQGAEPSPLDRSSMERFPLWWLIYSRPRRTVCLVRARAGRIDRATVRLDSGRAAR